MLGGPARHPARVELAERDRRCDRVVTSDVAPYYPSLQRLIRGREGGRARGSPEQDDFSGENRGDHPLRSLALPNTNPPVARSFQEGRKGRRGNFRTGQDFEEWTRRPGYEPSGR